MFGILLVALCQGLLFEDCHFISCNPEQSDTCVLVQEPTKSVLVSKCPEGFGCNFNNNYAQLGFSWKKQWTNTTCSELQVTEPSSCEEYLARPGSPHECCKDSDCASGECQVPICVGFSEGKACSASEDCLPDFYCSEGTCQKTKLEGEKCTQSEECSIGLGCDSEVCTEYFSKELGERSSSGDFCKSSVAYQGICDKVTIWEVRDFPVELEYPYECTIGNWCLFHAYWSGKQFGYHKCVCGGDGTGKGYCSIDLAFSKKDPVILEILDKLDYSNTYCSGSKVHSFDFDTLFFCNIVDKKTYEYAKQLFKKKLYWEVYHTGVLDECAADLGLFNKTIIRNYT